VTLLIELSPFFINRNICVYCGKNTCSHQALYNIVLYHARETPRDRKSLAMRGIRLWSLSRPARDLVEHSTWANIPASLGVFDNFEKRLLAPLFLFDHPSVRASSCFSVSLSAWKNSSPIRSIFIKFSIYEGVSEIFRKYWSLTKIYKKQLIRYTKTCVHVWYFAEIFL